MRYNGGSAYDMAVEVLGIPFPEPENIDFNKVKSIKMTAQQLGAYSGFYWDNERVTARSVYVKNDTLYYQNISSNTEIRLLPISENTFQLILEDDTPNILKFRKEGDKMKLIYTSGESDEYVYEAYNPINLSAADLSAFTGTFYNKVLKATYILSQNEKSY